MLIFLCCRLVTYSDAFGYCLLKKRLSWALTLHNTPSSTTQLNNKRDQEAALIHIEEVVKSSMRIHYE